MIISGPFPDWAAVVKAVRDILRRFGSNLDRVFFLELFQYRFQRSTTIGVHPDQQLAVAPRERWDGN